MSIFLSYPCEAANDACHPQTLCSPRTALDGDRSHGALLRFHNDFSSSINLDQYERADEIVNQALDSEQVVLMDLGAQSNKALQKWIADNELGDLCHEETVPLVIWHVMDDGKDSVDLLDDLLDRHQDTVDYVVVKNKGWGDRFAARWSSCCPVLMPASWLALALSAGRY